MKLNRAQALFLVGTLSAVGCVVETSDDGGEGGEAGDTGESGSAGTSAGRGGTTGGYSGSSGSGASSGRGGSTGAGTGGQTSGGAGGYAGAPNDCGEGLAGEMSECQFAGMPGSGGWDSGGQGGQGGQGGADENIGGAPSCDEEALPSVDCEGLSAFSCSADTFISDMCAIPAETLKGYVVDDVRNCMFALSEAELCDDATNVYGCLQSSLEASCPDPTAVTACEPLLAHCDTGTVDAEQCATYLSGMNPEGRAQIATCIEASSAEFCDLWSCVEGLSYPAVE